MKAADTGRVAGKDSAGAAVDKVVDGRFDPPLDITIDGSARFVVLTIHRFNGDERI